MADPVASTPIEPVGGAFVVQRGRHTANRYGEGRVERVDVDDGIKFSVDQTGDGRRDAAFCANVELRRPGAELVLRRGRWIADVDVQLPIRFGRPNVAMLRAEGASAGSSDDFDGIRLPRKYEADISAMATAGNQH